MITVDLHNPAILGFFENSMPIIDLDPLPLAVNYYVELFKRRNISHKEIVVISIDSTNEAVMRATHFKNLLMVKKIDAGLGLTLQPKEHKEMTHDMDFENYVGDRVKGKTCIIIDDMINNGKKAAKSASILKEQGAENIFMFSTHANFLNGCEKTLEHSDIDELLVTNTIPITHFM
jgi:ribose-phosphate pyrophosphokinase